MPKTITGQWSYPDGTAVANGVLHLTLSQDAVATGTSQIAPKDITIQLDATGSVPASTTIYANDELTPSGTVYFTDVYTGKQGGRVFGQESWSIAGTSPINLNNIVPTSLNISLANPVLQNPSAAQTITGQSLTLTSSAPLTVNSAATFTGANTHSGTETFKNFNTIRYAYQFPGSDLGAQVNAAIADLPVVGGYSVGTVSLMGYSQAQTQSTLVTINSPYVGVQGPGQGLLIITCSINGDCWRINTSPFSSQNALGVIGGFTLMGTGTVNGVGIHIGDIIGARIQDMHINAFTGASGAALWFDNVTNFTERSMLFNVWLDNSTKLLRFTNSNGAVGSSSFTDTRIVDIKMNVLAGQTGISIEGGIFREGSLHGYANATATSTVISVSGLQYTGGPGTSVTNSHFAFGAECTGCSGGTFISVASGTNLDGTGILDGSSGGMTNSISGTYNIHVAVANPAPGQLDTGSLDFVIPTGGTATSGANFSSHSFFHQGSIWNGSAAVADLYKWQNVTGSGTNPSTTLTLTHSGSSGVSQLDFTNIGNMASNNIYGQAVGLGGLGGHYVFTNTAPTIAAAGCGGAAASITANNGTATFKINVGTTPGSACTFTMPATFTGWNVTCNDITTQSTSVFVQKQTGAESTTSVTITNFNDVAVATAFVAGDVLKCTASAE